MSNDNHQEHKGLFKAYVNGFVLSVVLTLTAYFLVDVHISMRHTGFTHEYIVPILLFLAVIQFVVQLIFFLHMGEEKKPQWNLAVFFSFISVVLIIAISSLWIMRHLNYNMMPAEMEQKLLEGENMKMPGYSPNERNEGVRRQH